MLETIISSHLHNFYLSSRLLVTLRFLATGETYHNLSYGFRISVPALSQIIPETLEAIYAVLKDDYMKVFFLFRSLVTTVVHSLI